MRQVKYHKNLWMKLTVDSWLTAFYNRIWKKRCEKIKSQPKPQIKIKLLVPTKPIKIRLKMNSVGALGLRKQLSFSHNSNTVNATKRHSSKSSSEVSPKDLPGVSYGTKGLLRSRTGSGGLVKRRIKRTRLSSSVFLTWKADSHN